MTATRHERGTCPVTGTAPGGLALRFGLLALTAAGATAAGLALGAVSVPLREVVDWLLGRPVDPVSATILHDIRGPRTVTALLVGASSGSPGCRRRPSSATRSPTLTSSASPRGPASVWAW